MVFSNKAVYRTLLPTVLVSSARSKLPRICQQCLTDGWINLASASLPDRVARHVRTGRRTIACFLRRNLGRGIRTYSAWLSTNQSLPPPPFPLPRKNSTCTRQLPRCARGAAPKKESPIHRGNLIVMRKAWMGWASVTCISNEPLN